jgi:hypothetical protein
MIAIISTTIYIIIQFLLSVVTCLTVLDLINKSKYKDKFDFDRHFIWIEIVICTAMVFWPIVVPIVILICVVWLFVDFIIYALKSLKEMGRKDLD